MTNNLDDITCSVEDRKEFKELVYKKDLTKDELKNLIHKLDGILLKTANLNSENPFRLEVEYIRLCAVRKLDEIEKADHRFADRVHQYVQIALNAGLAIAVAVLLFKFGIKS